MQYHQSALVSLFVALAPVAALAASPAGTGNVAAPSLVSNITNVDSAMSEAKLQNKKLDSGNASSTPSASQEKPSAVPPPPPSLLPPPNSAQKETVSPPAPSRLELIGGSDRLVATSGALEQLSLFGEARYRISERWQLGASAGIRVQGTNFQGANNSRDVAVQLLFGPTFNFGDVSRGGVNSFFVSLKAGVTAERVIDNGVTVKSGMEPTVAGFIGKHFALGDHVAYVPSMGVVKQKDDNARFVVVPLAISFFF